MCAAPARDMAYSPQYLHAAVLDGLDPGAYHIYKLDHGEPVEFRAPPDVGAAQSLRFVVFGDMGESEHPKAKSPG